MIDHTVPPDVSYQNWLYYLNAKHRIMGVDWNPPVDLPAIGAKNQGG
jgi:hypothetical protein